MARNFTTEYEDGEKVFVCEVCLDRHDVIADAMNCCAQLVGQQMVVVPLPVEASIPATENTNSCEISQVSTPKKKPRRSPLSKFKPPKRKILRGPQPGCPYCGLAQTLGTVILCRCMY
jgi:hypothetical protein